MLKIFRLRLPIRLSKGKIFAGISILGLLFLSFVYGVAATYYDLFPANFLREALVGYEALRKRGVEEFGSEYNREIPLGIAVDKPEKTFDGFTLYTTAAEAQAQLMDMSGNIVHHWSLPFSKAWPKPSHVLRPLPDEKVHWFRAHLYPNGDLLAIYQTISDTPHGYGLAKLDKDSNLLWTYSGNAHHDLDVGADGTIYVLTHELHEERPPGWDSMPTPYLSDYLVVLSERGEELKKISLVEAFPNSPFALTLKTLLGRPKEAANPEIGHSMVADTPDDSPMPAYQAASEQGDVLHANAVKVLNPALAPKFTQFKAGQVLLSFRKLNLLAVLDIPSSSIVWTSFGIWKQQHDPDFLENGNLLLYDNSGWWEGTRILEVDPKTNAVAWSYANENSTKFHADFRGSQQRMANGNTLIVDPQGGRIFEVTLAKELVWEYGCPKNETIPPTRGNGRHAIVTGAFRYAPDRLNFLKPGISTRP